MAVGYKINLHTNTDQLERHKYKMISISKNIFMTRKKESMFMTRTLNVDGDDVYLDKLQTRGIKRNLSSTCES
jgi:hypothetical protein